MKEYHSPLNCKSHYNTINSHHTRLPEPLKEAKAHSDKLKSHILQKIKHSPQLSLSFLEFMNEVLYAKGLGYYMSGTQKFGQNGDFVTAPEISPLFAKCLARQCQEIQHIIPNFDILEVGAGSGQLAFDLLIALHDLNALPNRYYILELSPELKTRQQEKLRNLPFLLRESIFNKIVWLEAIENLQITGIILANEVLDALPINIYKVKTKEERNHQNNDNNGNSQNNDNKNNQNKEILELRVGEHNNEFVWKETLTQKLPNIEYPNIEYPNIEYIESIIATEYLVEISEWLPGWIKSFANVLKEGVMILIDYGFTNQEYYHPDRHMGTLMCHYQHHAHTNPFFLPGLQDITAHVDFSKVASAAVQNNLSVIGYTSQANFLINCGLIDSVSELLNDMRVNKMQNKNIQEVNIQNVHMQNVNIANVHMQNINITNAVNILTSPSEMGELFKVMALSKNLKLPASNLMGFENNDWLHKLNG